MSTQVYRYRFRDDVDAVAAELTLHLAIIAAEGLYGEARVRMDVGYAVDESIRAIIVDASTDVGLNVNAMFTAFLVKEFGRVAFDVRRVEGRAGCTCWEGGR